MQLVFIATPPLHLINLEAGIKQLVGELQGIYIYLVGLEEQVQQQLAA